MKNNLEYQCNGSKRPHPYSIVYVSPPRNLSNGCIEVREIAVCTSCLEHNPPKNLPVTPRIYLHIIDPNDQNHPIPEVNESIRQRYESYAKKTVEEIAKESEIISKMPKPRLPVSSLVRLGPDKSWYSPGERIYNSYLRYHNPSSKLIKSKSPTEFD